MSTSSSSSASTDDSDQRPRSSGGLRAWHVAGVVLLLAVLGLGLYGLWPVLTGQADDEAAAEDVEAPASTAEVDVVVASKIDFALRTRANGHLVPWQRANLKAEAGGPLVERTVEEGDRVEKGDLIARVRNREERIALEEARAELLKARAEFRGKYALGSDSSNVAASNGSGRLEGAGQTSQQATQAAVSGLTAARQQVERARLNLERTRVTAPFSGRVANLQVDEGQYVSQGGDICTLLQDRRMKVEVSVLEGDVVHVRKGATARVHVPALGPETDSSALVQGSVWSVNPQVDRESGTGRVTVSVPNTEGRLVSGLYANVWLETERLQDRLVVPDEAVLVRQGRDLVFVIEDGRAQWEYVDLGARSGNRVEITSGVAPGDTVAVDGHFALAHDAPVKVGEVRRLSPTEE